ncbi:MAG TPA: SDR family oxidoreductase [Dehalococcoidia bacterium]|jgi:NAD(P)-dependent dehydrogenase (short-subunit alcohol dehydrogenase family)
MVAQGVFGNQIRGATVAITGATSGIGYETARAFAAAGANVVVAGRRKERLDELVDAITRAGGQAFGVQTDVSDFGQVEALVARAQERFGRLDVLVNNAGVGLAAAFADVTLDEFRRLMDVNFWGVVHGCRAALPVMTDQRRGVIINVASIMGRRGMPFSMAYCASKFAVIGFSEALRTELAASNVAVSVVCPGAVESEIWQAAGNRLGGQLPEFPKYPTSQLAQVIVNDARWPQPEIVLSLDAQAIDFFNTFAPRLMDWTLSAAAPFMQALQSMQSGGPPGAAAGNLFQPRREQSTGQSGPA